MKSNHQSPAQVASNQLVKANDSAAPLKEQTQQTQRDLQSLSKQPTKKRYISRQSMAFMHC